MIKDKFITPRIYKFIDGEFFVFCNIQNHKGKTCLYKIKGVGGFGQSMFAGNVVGYQRFDSFITTMAYIEGYTFIGFDDGRILKINGTGGGGANMFAINKTANGFSAILGYNYLAGSHRFKSEVINISYIARCTFVSFKNKKILKINGSGGGGYNLFAINETTNGFNGLQGYYYYVGHQKLKSYVTNVIINGDFSFFSTKDCRIMKIRNGGGGGINMFAISETSYGYASVSGYTYLAGSYKFKGYVVCSLVADNVMFFGFEDKQMIKIIGSGGTGQNLFNITSSSIGYRTYSYQYNVWLLGSQIFFNPPREIAYIQSNLFISFPENVEGGGIYKFKGLGGTGFNMLNIFDNPNYQIYYLGRQLQSGSAQIIYFDNKIFWCISKFKYSRQNWPSGGTSYGTVVKVNGSDGPVRNILGLELGLNYNYDYEIKGLPGYTFWEGTEDRFAPNSVPIS